MSTMQEKGFQCLQFIIDEMNEGSPEGFEIVADNTMSYDEASRRAADEGATLSIPDDDIDPDAKMVTVRPVYLDIPVMCGIMVPADEITPTHAYAVMNAACSMFMQALEAIEQKRNFDLN